MDIRKVKKLIELLEESDINEIEIKEGEESVRISRASSAMLVAAAAPAMQSCTCHASCCTQLFVCSTQCARSYWTCCDFSHGLALFYRCPSPGAPCVFQK